MEGLTEMGLYLLVWTASSRINTPNDAPSYYVLTHEIGHAFEGFVQENGGGNFNNGQSSAFYEMTSQWAVWQEYPDVISFEHFHLTNFANSSYLAFMHNKNRYDNSPVMEWWTEKHGVDFIGKMWRQHQRGEDPVMVYKRLNGLNQKEFNNVMFRAAIHSITWDMPRIEKIAESYHNLFHTKLNTTSNGWYQVDKSNCPQNYGYNGIELQVPSAGTKVQLNFKGQPNAAGFRHIKTDKAGWRYGFLAYKKDGSRKYGKIYSNADDKVSFTVSKNTQRLWLVVMGAPTQHWIHKPDNDSSNDEQWPYEIKLKSIKPISSEIIIK